MAENLTLEGLRRRSASQRKKIMWVVGIVTLLAIIAGSYYFFFHRNNSIENEKIEADFLPAMGSTALYVNASRSFVFNVQGESRDRLVEISVQLLVRNEIEQQQVQANLPLIENQMITSFATATTEQWRDPRSRETLRAQVLAEVRDTLQKLLNTPAVEQILLTNYVMQ
ncbi:MAG: flagellar basal body-associated FliL family protein [Plesiomonas sp.]|uniref:flagellar basal body-associated FliL family protein n=1 Tax=Plesiomonas sp. TaxID=2486279 RepID=UPI003F37E924